MIYQGTLSKNEVRHSLPKSVILSCFLAGCLEMYDFVIFGFFASLFHKNYLAFLDEKTSLVITYALFAVGFLFRPIGSLIFGYIGDVWGRKLALVISVSLMGTASLAMFALPTYEQIGASACYIIALIRIVQGISVGGEYNGVTIYAIEHSNKRNIGITGSLVVIGATMGIILATFVSKLLQSPSLPDYAWRFAFLLGFGLSLIGYFIRKNLRETPEFEKVTSRPSGVPLLVAAKKCPRKFLIAIFAAAANISNVYYAMVFVPNYIKDNISVNVGLFVTILVFIFTPLFGVLSDRFSRVKLLTLSSGVLAIYNIFFLDLLFISSSNMQIVFYGLVAGMLIAAIVSTVNVFVVELFPTEYRFSCTTFCYSVGAAVFGGTVPMICAGIIKWVGDVPLYFGIYMSFLTLLGTVGGLIHMFTRGELNTQLTRS